MIDMFLNTLWGITFGSFLTAGLLVLIRTLGKRWLSAVSRYYLWMLLALRLCLPVLPGASFSLMNLDPLQKAAETPEITVTTIYRVESKLDQMPETTPPPSAAHSGSEATDTTAPGLASHVAIQPPTIDFNRVLFYCYLFGVVCCLVTYGVLTYQAKRRLNRGVPVEDPDTLRLFAACKRELSIRREVRVVYGEEAMIGGVRNPVLMIPRELVGVELEAALTHELLHYKSLDLQIAAFQRFLCCIYWFNPVVWLCFRQARLDCETACDARVLNETRVPPAVYANLLYQESRMKSRVQVGTTAFGKQNLKARIHEISVHKKPVFWMTLVGVLAASVVLLLTCTSANQRSLRWLYETPAEEVVSMEDYRGEQGALSGEERDLLWTVLQRISKSEFNPKNHPNLGNLSPDITIKIMLADKYPCYLHLIQYEHRYYVRMIHNKQGWVTDDRTLVDLMLALRDGYDLGGFGGDTVYILCDPVDETADMEMNYVYEQKRISFFYPAMDAPYQIHFSSEDESIAVVDDYGTVTALQPGSCKITAELTGDGVSISVPVLVNCEFTVNPFIQTMRESFSVGYQKSRLSSPGETISPRIRNGEGYTIHYASDNEEVAYVDENGLVTAVGEGACNIGYWWKSATGGGWTMLDFVCDFSGEKQYSDSMTILFEPDNPSLVYTANVWMEHLGDELRVNCPGNPLAVSYDVSDTSVVSVQSDCLVAVGYGDCTVTVSVQGSDSDTYQEIVHVHMGQPGNSQDSFLDAVIASLIYAGVETGSDMDSSDPTFIYTAMGYYTALLYPEIESVDDAFLDGIYQELFGDGQRPAPKDDSEVVDVSGGNYTFHVKRDPNLNVTVDSYDLLLEPDAPIYATLYRGNRAYARFECQVENRRVISLRSVE